MTILGTKQLRKEYAPAKANKGALFISAYEAMNRVLERYAYEVDRDDSGMYSPRPITGGTDWSIHAYGPGDRITFWNGTAMATAAAFDLNWNENPYSLTGKHVTDMSRAMVDEILAIRTMAGDQVFSWGGDWNKPVDSMHYQLACTKASLQSGIRGSSLPPKVTVTMQRGSNGPGVGFYQAMLNIVAPLRINAAGTGHGGQLKINKAYPEFGPKTEEATKEFQRFLVVMWELAGKKGTKPVVDGIAGPQTFAGLAFWVPLVLNKK